jgi:hypothetical protein
MRLLIALLLTLVTLSGCATFRSPFADRTNSRDSERERMLASINTKIEQGDMEGARRLMDQLDPQGRPRPDSRQNRSGIEIAAGVEQTAFQSASQGRAAPTQPPRDTRSERKQIIDELLLIVPPESRDGHRGVYSLMEVSQLRGLLANLRRTQESGQQIMTWPADIAAPATTQLPPGRETTLNDSPQAPEPGLGMLPEQSLGMPFPGSDGQSPPNAALLPQTLADQSFQRGNQNPIRQPAQTIQPAGGDVVPGGVRTVSGSTSSPSGGGQLPFIAGGNSLPLRNPNSGRPDDLRPVINPGQAELTNPIRDNPAVLEQRLEIPGEPQAGLQTPGHTPMDASGNSAVLQPPYPAGDQAQPPGMFTQNLTRIQRAGETIAARVWGQPDTAVESPPAAAPSPISVAISSLENELAVATPEESSVDEFDYQKKAVALRMLHLAENRYEKSIEPIQGIDSRDREFWQQMFWAMTNHFDTEGIPEVNTRAAETITQLRSAIDHLRDKADLQLRNVTFCHSIVSFGNYERFSRDQFTTGQLVLVYAEIENFTSKRLDDSHFQTALRSNIEIYPYAKQDEPAVASIPFEVTRDECRNVRRDYFHTYEFTIPEDLEPGRYTLVLQVSDQLSGKYATKRVQFEVE